ncbi:hypothetical protein [Polaromonas sp. A23]|uniref:FFLEELY motif protein n=1 Tax=Polaromonas sp. A23 TaxID=1944133 RepID=UPI0009846B10|nr:hypothetical protein [Polaromonas sp. A23]OOG43863.1 hypothetical protein B0B52_08055 [Polaromonas sp. A23]
MDPSATRIREAMETVSELRQERAADRVHHAASLEIKRLQAQRFKASYADLLQSPRYQRAANFFLNELYSDRDYAHRDQQFSRIANTIARLFPAAVVETAVSMAEVHALTEQLDERMAKQWLQHPDGTLAARYIQCWRAVADIPTRQHQLQVILHLGTELDQLTRMRGLRSLLKVMRTPAGAAGLSSLQRFLESGFDAFADMKGATEFLDVVEERESNWIRSLFEADPVACETRLSQLLAGTPLD